MNRLTLMIADFQRTNRFVVRVASILFICVAALFIWELRKPLVQVDDAFISYRYARNLVDGHGLVFNIGDYVEGYTNLLWVLLTALGIKFGCAAPVFAHWLCVISGVLLLLATYLYTSLLLPRSACLLATLSPLLLLSFNTFVKWTSSGLEQGLLAALVLFSLYFYTRKKLWWSCLFCILSTLTRPEGALYATLLLNVPWCVQLSRAEPVALRKRFEAMLPAVVFGSAILLVTSFRFFYYNDVVPNTFHAKVGGIPLHWGELYLYKFLVDGPGFLIPGTILAAYLVPRFRMGFAFLLLTVLYVIWVRGDVFPLGRFMLPVLPVMVTGSLLAIHSLYSRNRAAAAVFIVMLPLAAFFSLYVRVPVERAWFAANTLPDHRIIYYDFVINPENKSRFPNSVKRENSLIHDFFYFKPAFDKQLNAIRQSNPPVKLIASVGIGRLGYYGHEFRILDLVGLIDKKIAKSTHKVDQKTLLLPGHQRTDADYVFSRKPDLIFIPKKRTDNIITLPAVQDLWNHPLLAIDYVWDEKLGGYRRILRK